MVTCLKASSVSLPVAYHAILMTRLFMDNLTVVDVSLLDPEKGLLGESWQVDIELEGSLDHQGMVLDFGLVKRQTKQLIDEHFDHRLLVPAAYGYCRIDHTEHRIQVRFRTLGGENILFRAPASALRTVAAEQVTADSLSTAIIETIQPTLPDNVDRMALHLHTEHIEGAWYRYSHGLKHHSGNCQRIAHGHRSRIQIYADGQRSELLERQWAARWKDRYLGTRDDLLQEFSEDSIDYYRFGYTANQGSFELVLPKSRCYLIDSDSTVENLADYIARTLRTEHRNTRFHVKAFEGVEKGAFGEA